MFDEINGLPLHPLAVHAPVVLIPLAALLGLLFAIPRTRAWARLPFVLVALAAAGSTFVAKQSGQAFQETLEGNGALGGPVRDIVDDHAAAAQWLFYFMLGFAGVAIVAWAVTRSSRGSAAVANVLAVEVVLGAGLIGYQVYKVGDLGAKAVWNPTGQLDYSSSGSGED
jgi:hypothetical protein